MTECVRVFCGCQTDTWSVTECVRVLCGCETDIDSVSRCCVGVRQT